MLQLIQPDYTESIKTIKGFFLEAIKHYKYRRKREMDDTSSELVELDTPGVL
jgi:hypothetical protein